MTQNNKFEITPDDANIINKILTEYDIKSVVEFGIGLSTLIFLKHPNIKQYLGYEQNINITIKLLNDLFVKNPNILSKVKINFLSLPLSFSIPQETNQEQNKLLIVTSRFDLAFVDAPIGYHYEKLSKINNDVKYYSRFHTMKLSKLYSSKILIHDSNRISEQNSIQLLFPDSKYEKHHYNTAPGLTLCIRKD